MLNDRRPMIALSFDDGPMGDEGSATTILDTLETHEINATFFYCGASINDATQDEIKRSFLMGNEIGNHTTHHKDLTKLTQDEILAEVDTTTQKLTETIGLTNFQVRPPYIAINKLVLNTINVPLIGASVDSKDWSGIPADEIIHNVLSQVHDGAIILMHENQIHTGTAIKVLVPALLQQGYQITTVSKMMYAKGVNPLPGQLYSHA